jgi:hypothetical protein
MVRKALLATVAIAGLLAVGCPAAQADQELVSLSTGDLSPFYGRVNPFYGRVNPFYGRVNPFYGRVSPFWGDISPFWGKINPFDASVTVSTGDLLPFWGKINPFTAPNSFLAGSGTYWQSAGPQWGDLNSQWSSLQAANATDYSGLQTQLNGFLSNASATWTPVAQKSQKSFDFMKSFALPLMAQYHIDPNNAASLANVSDVDRAAFFLDFYDGLMNFTGTDHVDWWMAAVHWSPSLAQIQGSANNAAVGILDAYTTPAYADVNKLTFIGGYKNNALDHGAAVASLIAAKQNGDGVMGVAPNATIQILYNPFDASGTADWSDVANGIAALFNKKASVVNASLGVPGSVLSSEWSSILNASSLVSTKHQLVLVKAAGNDGVVQTENVAWSGAAPTNLILVGSVDPNGNISSFSNTPGEACIVIGSAPCNEQDKLKYRFMVAPGELILVQDNHGGVTRVSGTSFAAPLVTGTVSLLQDRWPWLQQYADETVQIVLRSATDLGAPGVDPVYGWGELNVEAAQSPLNWDNLQVFQGSIAKADNVGLDPSKLPATTSSASLKASILMPGQLALWQNQNAYVVAFEKIGGTYRDFEIPLSSLLATRNINIGVGNNPFQSYLYQRMIDWANGTSSLGFTSHNMEVTNNGWRLSMTATAATPEEMTRSTHPFHSDFVATNDDLGLAVRFGEGNAAHAFSGNTAFGLRSDFDPATGGVNPILGFASGGAYAQGNVRVVDGLKFNFGVTQSSDNHVYLDPTFGPAQTMPLAPKTARASVVGFSYDILDGISLNASYTDLAEANGLLGAQGGGALDLGNGRTGGITVGATANIGGWLFSQSFTRARTTADGNGFLSIVNGSLQTTAYEFAATRENLFNEGDRTRLAVTQPLHIAGGALQYTALAVSDRSNGTLGTVTQTWNVGSDREYRIEASYGLPVLKGRADLEGFAMLDINGFVDQGQAQATSAIAGARMKLKL